MDAPGISCEELPPEVRHHPWVYPMCGTCISMYVLEWYLINVNSVGWANATQLRDIVFLLCGQNL